MAQERAKKPKHGKDTKVAPGQKALTGLEDELGYDVCLLSDPRHEVFCREYAVYNIGSRAYEKAYPGCSPETARSNACKLLTNTNITNRIKQITAERMEKLEVTHEKILREVAKLAFLDPREFYRDDGSIKSIHDMDPDAVAALEGMKVRSVETEKDNGFHRQVFMTEIKHSNKRGALELLMRYKEMIVEKHDHGIIGVTDDLVRLQELRQKFSGGMSGHG